MNRAGWFGSLFLMLAISIPRPVHALAIGLVDDFEDGTTQNWAVGILGAVHPFPPVNEPTGGPAGADDNFLRLTSTGSPGAGGRMAVLNVFGQWAGNYLATGITAIGMDVNNLGDTELNLRLLIEDPLVGPPTNVAFSALPFVLPGHSGWVHAVFPVTPGALLAETGTVDAALANATALRIFNNALPAPPGPPIRASLGVDNITAVPEPASLLLVGAGLAVAAVRKRRRA